jgi:hypothetical protein
MSTPPTRSGPRAWNRGGARFRITAFVAVCVIVVGATAVYLLAAHSREQQRRDTAAPVAQASLANLDSAPRIVFRNMSLREGYGSVAVVALDDPDGPRALTGTACDRVYATAANVLCLASDRGLLTTYSARILDDDYRPVRELPLTGVPSRARLSADGQLAATTSFVAGDSYASLSFSTRTVITELGPGATDDLEYFTLIHDGREIQPVDRNYWGVTFGADDNTFYATVKFDGVTWLVRGDLARRTMTTLHADAECPSLSPDGRSIVYKERGDRALGQWRLMRYDVATGDVVALAEPRSVDDQVEWLDDGHVMYGVPRSGSEAGISDVWVIPTDGAGAAQVLIPQAWSPAVIR